MEEKSVLGLHEVVLLLFSTVALFMIISLMTFSNDDAGFSHSGSLQAIHNACGVIGAWISDFTLCVFGLMAYFFPLMFAWVGYLVYRDQLHTEKNTVILMRYIGFVVTLAFGSALFYLHLSRTDIALPGGTGGILGQELGDVMILMFGNSGATLFLLVGFLISITLFTDLSWLGVMDFIGKGILSLFGFAARKRQLNQANAKEPKLTEPLKAQALVQEELLSKGRQKSKISPVMQDVQDMAKSSSAGEGGRFSLNRLSGDNLNRHEPQFDDRPNRDAFENTKSGMQAERVLANQAKASGSKGSEARAVRQEPQFDHQATGDPLMDAPKRTVRAVNASLSAKVLGHEADRGLNADSLANYPPQLYEFDLTNYPAVPPEPKISARVAPVANHPSAVQQAVPKRPNVVARPVVHASANASGAVSDVLPSLSLLDERDTRVNGYSAADLEEMSRLVEAVLQDFNVVVDVVAVHPGPVITRFELQPAAGVKVSRISGLAKDMARSLSVTSVRIVENIPGKSVIGLEIPNQEREMVTLRELLISPVFKEAKSVLTLAMGKDIAGIPVVADLGKMPHALVAGTTGSGKSVAINTMILSLLYKATPEQVRIIMIDPKMLELSVYEGIPHLLTPVVTDMKEANNALRWAVAEMERRYKLMSKMGVRNLAGFNQLIADAAAKGETIRDPMFQYDKPLGEYAEFPVLSALPSIVIVIDELADMMMVVGKKVEELIARLAQKARAAGIHLILATQRPSVDVLTGLIKANVPTRISFQVSSRIDSRTILDQGGAETLLGNGDMLFLPSGTAIPIRAHGAFVDDHEVHRVVEFLKQTAPPNYLDEITREIPEAGESNGGMGGDDAETDVLYDQAVHFVTKTRKASISSVQRQFKVGYNRAARMIEDMELAGVVSPAESNGYREVLAPAVAGDD